MGPGPWLRSLAARIISAAFSAFWLSTGSNVTGATPAKSRIVFSAPSVASSEVCDSLPAMHPATVARPARAHARAVVEIQPCLEGRRAVGWQRLRLCRTAEHDNAGQDGELRDAPAMPFAVASIGSS